MRPLSHSSSLSTNPPTLNHSRYFFNDGSVIFKIYDTLYKVHYDILKRHSDFFYNEVIQPAFHRIEGTRDHSPIVLRDVEPAQMDAFLSLFYPSSFLQSDISTADEWTAVLALSTQWKFSSLRELAIQRLASITSPAEKVVLGRAYAIEAWIIDAYTQLCTSRMPLSRQDARMLGLEDVMSIWELQHELDRGGYDEMTTRRLVEEHFPPVSMPVSLLEQHVNGDTMPAPNGIASHADEDVLLSFHTESTRIVMAHGPAALSMDDDQPSPQSKILTPINEAPPSPAQLAPYLDDLAAPFSRNISPTPTPAQLAPYLDDMAAPFSRNESPTPTHVSINQEPYPTPSVATPRPVAAAASPLAATSSILSASAKGKKMKKKKGGAVA